VTDHFHLTLFCFDFKHDFKHDLKYQLPNPHFFADIVISHYVFLLFTEKSDIFDIDFFVKSDCFLHKKAHLITISITEQITRRKNCAMSLTILRLCR
jgi:hypothetical protein